MTRVLSIAILLISLTSIAEAAGDWWGGLEGDVGIGQVPLVDPIFTDPPAAYLVIKGEAAKRMYEKMVEAIVLRGRHPVRKVSLQSFLVICNALCM